MAYTDDSVKAKLSSLNETQESIVTVAQWIMFHRRHADRTAQLWLQKLKESGSGKRLNLIYLANEVAQQSKARRKDEFLIAFSPIITEGTATAYKGAIGEVQGKIRRVIDVWRQRQIFELPIQEAVEARISEIDKSRSSGKKSLLGGSIFSGGSSTAAPTELQPLVPLQIAVSKAVSGMHGVEATASAEYDKLMDPNTPAPAPPVHAARLSALLKSLASAEGAVSESIKARRDLLGGLEKLLETNRTALAQEESRHQELTSRKTTVETKKRDVEDVIMRGLSADPSAAHAQGAEGVNDAENGHRGVKEPERPQVEELTPPPMENFTPVGSPFPGDGEDDEFDQPAAVQALVNQATIPAIPAGLDLLSSLSVPAAHSYGKDSTNGGMLKKRKLDDETNFVNYAGGNDLDDLDADVEELLRSESGRK